MKIKAVLERDCCQQRDLKPVEGSPKRGSDVEIMFCIYCGAHHKIHTFMDAAGSMDWEYRKEKVSI